MLGLLVATATACGKMQVRSSCCGRHTHFCTATELQNTEGSSLPRCKTIGHNRGDGVVVIIHCAEVHEEMESFCVESAGKFDTRTQQTIFVTQEAKLFPNVCNNNRRFGTHSLSVTPLPSSGPQVDARSGMQQSMFMQIALFQAALHTVAAAAAGRVSGGSRWVARMFCKHLKIGTRERTKQVSISGLPHNVGKMQRI